MKYMYFILLFLSFSWHATISGIITNSETKKSIPNANVIIKEIEFGVASSPYGYYKINIPEAVVRKVLYINSSN